MSAPSFRAKIITARELAEQLGISIDTLYRTRSRLHVEDGLPAPISRHRPFRWHRASIEAWLGRHHPIAQIGQPANDLVACEQTIEQQREDLRRVYARR